MAASLCGTAGLQADDNRGTKGAGAERLTGRGEAANTTVYEEAAGAEIQTGDDNRGKKGSGAERLTGQQDQSDAEESAVTESSDAAEAAGAEKDATGKKNAANEAKTDDEKFVEAAAKSGMADIKMGELAAQKGQSASVKQFGTRLAKDCKEAGEKLKQICDRKHAGKNISEADKQTKMKEMEAECAKKTEHLSSLSGAEFDKAFIEHTVTGHQKSIKKFEKQASEGEDPAYRSFASETLPTLREHLKIAQSLQENPNASLPEVREPAGAEIKSDADAQKSESDLNEQKDDDKESSEQEAQDDTKKSDAQITP